jgi:hypothetical protein
MSALRQARRSNPKAALAALNGMLKSGMTP